MAEDTGRILTTHTGSLPRPAALAELLVAMETGNTYDIDTLEREIANAVSEVMNKQRSIGLDVISDGEMGRFFYATYVKDRLTGFDGMSLTKRVHDTSDFPEFYANRTSASRALRKTPACTGPITYSSQQELKKEIERVLSAKEVDDSIFLSAASPGVVACFFENQYYQSAEAYIFAIAEAMKLEYDAIHQAGFILQLDCPDLAMGRHFLYERNEEHLHLKNVQLNVEAMNYALRDIPSDSVRMHVCWGNYEGPHTWDIPLEQILPLLLLAKPATMSIEGSNPRHAHEWSVFERVALPPGKKIIPGVIDSVSNFVEHPELVAERLCRYASIVGRDNIIAGSDCGFGTSAVWTTVEPRVAWAKLSSLVEGTLIANKRLWG